MPVKVAIGCSNYLYSEGLKKLLADERDVEIVGILHGNSGSFTNLEDVISLNPDVIVADFNAEFNILLQLPDSLLVKKLKILLIGDRNLRFVADKQLKDLVMKGVLGILPPSADSDLLRKALRAVYLGELWLDRNVLMKLIRSMKEPDRSVGLAKREKEIVYHICHGYRNKEIAEKLHISEQTVKSHCNRIYKKLGVSDRLQLALYSYKIFPSQYQGAKKLQL